MGKEVPVIWSMNSIYQIRNFMLQLKVVKIFSLPISFFSESRLSNRNITHTISAQWGK